MTKKIILILILLFLLTGCQKVNPISKQKIQTREINLGADTGYRSPSANGSLFNTWLTPANAYSSDDNLSSADYEEEQDYYNFGFSIPAGSTIDGIIVSIEGFAYGDPDRSLLFDTKLSYNGGSNWTTVKQETWIGRDTDEIKTYGSSSDTWGRTWSVDDFSNTNFRIYFVVPNGDADEMDIDHIQIKVYYTEAGGETSKRNIIFE